MSANPSRVRSIRASMFTPQGRRTLRLCRRAQQLHRKDVLSGAVDPRGWGAISNVARAEYRLRAEQEITPPPQFPTRDEVVGRDQVTRRERARILRFGDAHA